MRTRLLILIPLFFLMLIMPVYAETEISLLTLHEALGDRLGVGAFAGGLIASVIFLMMTVFPVAMINRSRKGAGGFMAELIVGMSVLGVCVAITWFPVWIFVVLAFLIALLFSGKLTELLGK